MALKDFIRLGHREPEGVWWEVGRGLRPLASHREPWECTAGTTTRLEQNKAPWLRC